MLDISPSAVRDLVAHCRAEVPNEACGYLVGAAPGEVSRFVPIANAAASPTRFVLDPAGQLAAEQAVDAAGEQVVGIAHSHPAGEAVPSSIDIADAARYDPFGVFVHAIVEPDPGVVRWYRIVDGAVESLEPG
ncbi:MAG: M67 family metallopeptidase [Actinomycetota bacterium]